MLPIPPSVATFFGKRIVQVIIILGLVAFLAYAAKSYHDSVYESGMTAGIAKENKVWTERETKRIAEENQRIDDLEKVARDLADAHAKEIKLRDARIAKLDKKVAEAKPRINTIIYKSDGTPNRSCPTNTPIFLGTEFSDLWNQYNHEVWK